ncbi:MAG: hypothetical protein LLG20_01020 [Acidobacteriales bacterium]|nr:hypothetical protein [Terriglobales bacterium]
MDLKIYYQKLRETERQIKETHPVVVSKATPDGGKEGVMTEVARHVAAGMIADGKARLATTEEAAEFRSSVAAARKAAEQAAAAGRVALSVLPAAELQMLRGALNLAKAHLQEKA